MYLRSFGSESIVCKAIKSSAGLTGGFAFKHEEFIPKILLKT